MRNLIKFFILGVPVGFFAIGCGEAGDTGSTQSVAPAEEGLPADAEMVFLKVEGMTWAAKCVAAVQSALAKVDGVKSVDVQLEGGKASVVTEKGKVSPEQLIEAVSALPGGYKATSK